MRPYIKYTTREPGRLKPRTLVFHKIDRCFFEVHYHDSNGVYDMFILNPDTGERLKLYEVHRVDVELIAPTHPVYIKWAQRRLADRLEGLDRT